MLKKLLILSCLCLPLLSFSKKQKKQTAAPVSSGATDYRQMGAPMPPLRTVKMDGKIITNKTVEGDGNLILMMFNPTCEHCEDMTQALEKNDALIRKTKIVLIAGANMMPYLEYFTKGMKTDGYPKLQIGIDSAEVIEKLYNYTALPQLNIYDKDRRLIKVFSGITTIDSLKAYLD